MKIIIILILLQQIKSSVQITLEDYCKPYQDNTPCLYKCTLSETCSTQPKGFDVFTDSERAAVLDAHNKYRNEVAAGMHTKFFLEPARDMQILSYDKECEFITSCYMFQCIWAHDKRRLNLNGERQGQNLYRMISSNANKGMKSKYLFQAVSEWFGETKYMNSTFGEMFKTKYDPTVHTREPTIEIGHLAALIWAKAKYVGCGKMVVTAEKISPSGRGYCYYLFCNYFPGGNLQGHRVYRNRSITDPPCTTGEPDKKYTSLCGDVRHFDKDDYEPPLAIFSRKSATTTTSSSSTTSSSTTSNSSKPTTKAGRVGRHRKRFKRRKPKLKNAGLKYTIIFVTIALFCILVLISEYVYLRVRDI